MRLRGKVDISTEIYAKGLPSLEEDKRKSLEADAKAVALKYDKAKNPAPHVVAKGKGALAERIRAVAEEHDIPIHVDGDLVEVLEKLEIEQEIPLDLYTVVAEIFAYLYNANDQKKKA